MRFKLISMIICVININGIDLKVIAEWDSLDFVFPSPNAREDAIQNGEFVKNNCVPFGIYFIFTFRQISHFIHL